MDTLRTASAGRGVRRPADRRRRGRAGAVLLLAAVWLGGCATAPYYYCTVGTMTMSDGRQMPGLECVPSAKRLGPTT
jgi:hypothetical protein